MNTQLLRIEDVVKATGMSRSMIYKRIAKGHFPKSYPYPNSRYVYWLRHEVDSWIVNAIKEAALCGY